MSIHSLCLPRFMFCVSLVSGLCKFYTNVWSELYFYQNGKVSWRKRAPTGFSCSLAPPADHIEKYSRVEHF